MHTTPIEVESPEPAGLSPRRAEAVGMWLFLAALTMLFLAAMLGYLLVRGRLAAKTALKLEVPWSLWLSTGILLAASGAIEVARRLVRREKQRSFRLWMMASLVLSFLFVIVQVPSLILLLDTHATMKARGVGLYGLTFALILLHAAHVLSGLIPLSITVRRAFRGAYDHENYSPVSRLVMYWHFLDAVWVMMFGVFVFLR
ncbi:MAG: cytochrome c oxidase subunit 3 [Phycisphaeraceae bacterium]